MGREGDITSKVLIPKSSISKATIVVKERAVICGVKFAKQTFKKLDTVSYTHLTLPTRS